MAGAMAMARTAPPPAADAAAVGHLSSLRAVHRSEEGRVVAGVASGIGDALGADPVLVRLVFAILALADGSGIVLYLGAWLFLPPPGAPHDARGRAAKTGGIVLFFIAAVLALRGLGLGGSLLISGALIGGGVALVARYTRHRRVSRQLVLGAVLVVAGTIFYVNESGPFADAGGPIAPGGIAIGLIAIVAPWLWRLARERDAERLARTRSQERAEMAARIHDSVLQTMALVQRHADDPRRVATLARRQERELRSWLYGPAARSDRTVVAAIERAAEDVEELHGVRVDIVSTGDAPLDGRLDALVLAVREALTMRRSSRVRTSSRSSWRRATRQSASSSATAASVSTATRSRPTDAGSATRSKSAWRATAGARRSRPLLGRGRRSS